MFFAYYDFTFTHTQAYHILVFVDIKIINSKNES